MPVISVIVPVYNVEKYLPKCLESIINQSYKSLEIILVDDGSTDNSGVICDEYAAKDKRIKVIHKTNGGLSDARNAGLDICTGDYIGFVDSDDWIAEDMYETLYSFAVKEDLDVAMCAAYEVYEDGTCIIPTKKFLPLVTTDKNKIINEIFVNKAGGVSVAVWSKLFSKKKFGDIRFKKGKISEDVFFIFDWLNKTNRFGRLSDSKYYYLQRNASLTHLPYYKDGILDVVEGYELNFKIVKAEYSQSTECAAYRLQWAYMVAVNRILDCQDARKHYDVILNLQKKIRKQIITFVKNNYISKKQKMALLALSFNLPVYMFMKALYQRLKNKILLLEVRVN